MFSGFILGILYFKYKNTEHKGPNSKDIKELTFDVNGEYIKLVPIPFICPPSKNVEN